jgi:Prealbumin-like fold domain
MTAVRKSLRRRRKPIGFVTGLVALAAVLVFAIGANTASLPGSNFEIDDPPSGSNFTVDLPDPPSLDWNNVDNSSQPDRPTGQTDDSYKGGVKEDTSCPDEVTGSIPNNKSDLKTYLAYQETEADGPGFLNLGWIRVSDPSGTTLMDFELNHSSTPCANGPNVIRTPGDLLIEYAITQGGAVANITAREWSGSAWGPATPLPGQAIGTINLVPIPANQTGGESAVPLAARTFGEMSLDLDFIFDEGTCESFGSTQLKSRSSDAFSSQLKDFIRPIPINLTNCGNVIIRKQTDPDGESQLFDYTKAFPTDPASSDTFQLADGDVQDYEDSVLIGSGYTVDEDVANLPDGWEFVNLDCSASSADTDYTVTDANVTFDLAVGDTLDCTYNNRMQQGAIEITKQRKHAADGGGLHPHEGVEFTITGGNLPAGGTVVTTDADGIACLDSLAFATDYVVTEEVPAGYVSDDAVKEATVDTNSDCGDGNEAPVSFVNTPLTDLSVVATGQVEGGTQSSIVCVDASNDEDIGNSPVPLSDPAAMSALGLEPGEYDCHVVIDP